MEDILTAEIIDVTDVIDVADVTDAEKGENAAEGADVTDAAGAEKDAYAYAYAGVELLSALLYKISPRAYIEAVGGESVEKRREYITGGARTERELRFKLVWRAPVRAATRAPARALMRAPSIGGANADGTNADGTDTIGTGTNADGVVDGVAAACRELERIADALTKTAAEALPPLIGERRAVRLERGEPAVTGGEPDGTKRLSLPLSLFTTEEADGTDF